jgi:hypothetical protein
LDCIVAPRVQIAQATDEWLEGHEPMAGMDQDAVGLESLCEGARALFIHTTTRALLPMAAAQKEGTPWRTMDALTDQIHVARTPHSVEGPERGRS